MPPGEEDNEELVDDVEIGDVEVVFERRHIDVAANLRSAKRVSKEAEHKESQLETSRHGILKRKSRTFCSTYSWPCLKAVCPNCAATWAVGSFMNCPYAPKALPMLPPCCCWYGFPP